MHSLIKLLVTPAGRVVRIVAGVVLIAAGLLWVGGTVGIVVAIVGAVPLLAGIFDVCVFAPIFGLYFNGPKTRAAA